MKWAFVAFELTFLPASLCSFLPACLPACLPSSLLSSLPPLPLSHIFTLFHFGLCAASPWDDPLEVTGMMIAHKQIHPPKANSLVTCCDLFAGSTWKVVKGHSCQTGDSGNTASGACAVYKNWWQHSLPGAYLWELGPKWVSGAIGREGSSGHNGHSRGKKLEHKGSVTSQWFQLQNAQLAEQILGTKGEHIKEGNGQIDLYFCMVKIIKFKILI